MALLLVAILILIASGVAALAVGRSRRWSTGLAVTGVVTASILGLVPAIRVLLDGVPTGLRAAWSVPYGSFAVELDALSAFFLVPIFAVSSLAAIYGGEYLGRRRDERPLGAPWFFFNLLVSSMVLVVVAKNGILFLVAWEVMALASFFLITFENDLESVREAGWTYLVATHLGTAFLLAMFVLLGRQADSLDFDRFEGFSALAPTLASTIFILALVGFGTKAGLVPFHVWLPAAHPAAPSHVSALLSAVMIKTGIYGLLRVLSFLGPPEAWWGWLLVGLGLASSMLGILFALVQHDLKRLLAYSSVENVGIITMGIGIGLLGIHAGSPRVAVLGFAGALLHVLNHSFFKGILFFAAGSVVHATGTRTMDRLGGLAKRMPVTSVAFVVGAVAISGLPPLNGFASEFLIGLSALRAATSLVGEIAVPALAVVAGLALVGGLAVACFAKAFGIVFLGEPRTAAGAGSHDPGLSMRAPMIALVGGCVAVAAAVPMLLERLVPTLAAVTALSPQVVSAEIGATTPALVRIACVGAIVLTVVAGLWMLRRALLSGRSVASAVTWDCGAVEPTPRMQYTGSSFSQPLTDLFGLFLGTRRRLLPPLGPFPDDAALSTETPDACREVVYRPVFTGIGWFFARLRWIQHGQLHLYVLYIAVTLVILLVWNLAKA